MVEGVALAVILMFSVALPHVVGANGSRGNSANSSVFSVFVVQSQAPQTYRRIVPCESLWD